MAICGRWDLLLPRVFYCTGSSNSLLHHKYGKRPGMHIVPRHDKKTLDAFKIPHHNGFKLETSVTRIIASRPCSDVTATSKMQKHETVNRGILAPGSRYSAVSYQDGSYGNNHYAVDRHPLHCCLSVCLSVCLFFLSGLSVFELICLYCVRLHLWLYVCLSVFPSVCMCLCMYVCMYVRMCVRKCHQAIQCKQRQVGPYCC